MLRGICTAYWLPKRKADTTVQGLKTKHSSFCCFVLKADLGECVCVCFCFYFDLKGILFLESFLTKNLRSLFKRLPGFIRGNTPYCHFSLQTFGCEAWYKTSTPLKTDAGLADILESCLPAGTLTGALRSRTLTPFSECSTFYLTMTFWQAILFIVLTTVLCHESSWL